MTLTPIQVFQKASELGLKLGFEPPDTLTVEPARLCPPDFASVLKAHKPALLALLGLPFVMVFSEILGETIFFCEDEDTKTALIEAGTDEWGIYRRMSCARLWRRTGRNRFCRTNCASCAKSSERFTGGLPDEMLHHYLRGVR